MIAGVQTIAIYYCASCHFGPYLTDGLPPPECSWCEGTEWNTYPARRWVGLNRTPSVKERFDYYVPKGLPEDVCWEWTGSTTGAMHYGQFSNGDTIEPAHRFAYRLTYGDFDEELFVLHRCDNPPCVNPKHLFLGTHQDNMDDMISKGRASWQKPHLKITLAPSTLKS